MINPQFHVRQMNAEDLKIVISWASHEGWLFSLHDVEVLLSADPNGFFIGEIDKEPIASFAAIKQGDYCFWNLFIVKQEYRGKGYGTQILNHARNYFQDSKVMALDATTCHVSTYQKYGFKTACQNVGFSKKAEGKLHAELVDLHTVPIDQLVKYDTDVFGYPRKKVFEALLNQRTSQALGIVEDNKLVGYGFVRKSPEGYYIGPISADNKEKAKKIFEGLQSFVAGEDVYADVFETNEEAMKIMEEQGWSQVCSFSRMYARGKPKTDAKRMFVPFDEIS